MGHEHVIDPTSRLIRVRMWGVITRSEILETVQQVIADPRFTPDLTELIDLREVTSTESLTANDVRQIATSTLEPVSRRAFVTPDPSTYGLARMFGAHRELHGAHEKIGVFTKLEEAEAWLEGKADSAG